MLELNKKRLNQLGRDCLGKEHYKNLRRFFEKVWENADQYNYCVFLTRRCFNLHELFLQTFNKSNSLSDKHLLSENALILTGEKIANSYVKHGKIPNILIVDDILVHGRTLALFLYKLEQKIYLELERLGARRELLELLHINFIHAIDIRVYLENQESILLEIGYQWRIDSQKCVPRCEWHELSQGISLLISLSDVENTSFVLSLAKNDEVQFSHHFLWRKVRWVYREKNSTFYYRILQTDSLKNIILSVRIRELVEGASYVPFVFTGEPINYYGMLFDFKKLLKVIKDKTVFKPLCKILNQDDLEQQYQLIQLLFSIVTLYWFSLEVVGVSLNDLKNLGKFCDVKKIFRNFSYDKKFREALINIFREDEFMQNCIDFLPKWFNGISAQQYDFYSNLEPEINEQMLALNRKLENQVYEEGLKSEKFAYLIGKLGRAYSPTKDEIMSNSLEEFLEKDFLKELPLYPCLSCLLMLADAGVVSLKPRRRQCNNLFSDSEWYFQSLRAGEQALFCKPRQLALYIPAMLLIEYKCLSSGKERVIRRIGEFKQFLENTDIQFPEKIPKLEEFATEWYKIGGTINDWLIPLLFDADGRAVFAPGKNRKEYFEHLRLIQNKIWESCKEFLKKNKIAGHFI